jgi:hypothetical protein
MPEIDDADRFWDSIVGELRRAAGFAPTPEELEAELDSIEVEPMTKAEIERIVRWVIAQDDLPKRQPASE